MASNHTPNYQLSQWEAEDQVKRTDFNGDNEKIDAALGELARTVAGHTEAIAGRGNCQVYTTTYTGDGSARVRSVSFPYKPMLVVVMEELGTFFMAIQGIRRTIYQMGSSGSSYVTWSGNSFSWNNSTYIYFNESGQTYFVLALMDVTK